MFGVANQPSRPRTVPRYSLSFVTDNLPIKSKLTAADEACGVAREYTGCALSRRQRSFQAAPATRATELQIGRGYVDGIIAPGYARVQTGVPPGPAKDRRRWRWRRSLDGHISRKGGRSDQCNYSDDNR
jgi:hypothetical protein